MVRKQVFITVEQNRRLKEAAAASGKPEGEIMRASLDQLLSEKALQADDWKTGWQQAAGMWSNYPEIEQIMARRREARFRRRQQPSDRHTGS